MHSRKARKTYAANIADAKHKADYVFPVLMMEVLRQALQSSQILRGMEGKVKMVECTYEADHHIAQFCARVNKNCDIGKEKAVILGCDSDFMVMRGCAYIWLNRCSRSKSGYWKDLVSGNVDGKIWRRKNIAASLGLSEENFREFCIMLGNDYTNIYEWSDFDTFGDTSITQTGPAATRTAALLEAFIAAAGGKEGTKLVLVSSSGNSDLQYAIDFSRAMYELEDVDDPVKWPDHKDDSESEGLRTKSEREVSLTREQKNHVRAWSHKQATLLGRSHVGNDICAYLKEAIRKDGTFGGPMGDIKEVHLRALEICMVLLPFYLQLENDVQFWDSITRYLDGVDESYDGFYSDGFVNQCQNYFDLLTSNPEEARYGGKAIHEVFCFLCEVHDMVYGPGSLREYEQDWKDFNTQGRRPSQFLSDYLAWPEDFRETIAKTSLEYNLSEASTISWPTLRAGVLLELIYREFISRTGDVPAYYRREGVSYEYDTKEEHNKISSLYHAKLFHIVVQQLEKEGYGVDGAGNAIAVFDDFLMNGGYDKRVAESRVLEGNDFQDSAGRALPDTVKGESTTPASPLWYYQSMHMRSESSSVYTKTG